MVNVENWISWGTAEKYCEHLPGMGGWFGSDIIHGVPKTFFVLDNGAKVTKSYGHKRKYTKHRWNDYVRMFKTEQAKRCARAVRDLIIARLPETIGGFTHQNEECDGMPLADCGGYYDSGFRSWGDITAASLTYLDTKNKKKRIKHCYADYAW